MNTRSRALALVFCFLITVSFAAPGFAEQNGPENESFYFSVSEQYQFYEPEPSPETISLRPGGYVLLYPRIIYTGGEDKLISDVVWNISDPQVVSIDKDFILRGIKEGSAVVTASYEGHTAFAKVVVNRIDHFETSFYPADVIRENGTATIIMKKNSAASIVLNAFHTSGVKENVSRVAKWESKNSEIAYVTATGNPLKGDVTLFGVNEGETEITASLDGLTEKIKIKVESDENKPTENLTSQITVMFNGAVQTYDQPPVIVNERVLVPLRGIFEALGASVSWDGKTRTVTATEGETTVQLKIGSATAYKNGAVIHLDQSPLLINDRTMVPVRFVGEALGAEVDWDEIKRTVIIAGKTSQDVLYKNDKFGFSLLIPEDFMNAAEIKEDGNFIYFVNKEIQALYPQFIFGVVGRIETYDKREFTEEIIQAGEEMYGLKYLGENERYYFGRAQATDVQVPPGASEQLIREFRAMEEEFTEIVKTFKILN